MIWIAFCWLVGLVEFGNVSYQTLTSLKELPQPLVVVRWRRLIIPFFTGGISVLCFGVVVNSIRSRSDLPIIIVAVGILALLIGYLVIRRERISIGTYTPYDLQHPFDLFISYRRTVFAERVRHISEALISQGIRVWLDDYAMFATNLQSSEEMDIAIRAGIKNSMNALIYESSDYNESDWCKLERKELQKHFHLSPSSILSSQPRDTMNEWDEAATILKELHRQPPLTKSLRANGDFIENHNFFHDERAGYQFDARGWAIVNRGGYFFLIDQYKGPFLTCRKDTYQLNLNIDIGPSATYPDSMLSAWRQGDKYSIIQRALEDLFKGSPKPGISEKALWQAGYRFAQQYAILKGVAIRGTHIFILGKEYHFALTYWDKRGWVRRYSVVAIDPLTWVRLEIAIGFKFFGPFLEFCAWAHHMDTIVHSFCPLPENLLHSKG